MQPNNNEKTTIILTGSTGGLGRCLTKVLADMHIGSLFCIYRNPKKFALLLNESKNIQGYRLSDQDDFSGLFEMMHSDCLTSVILILNAFTISPIKRVGDMSDAEIESALYGNITRNFLLINRTVHFCKKKKLPLRIINLDSGAADHPLTGWAGYCASKAYLNMLLSVVSKENPDYQIVSFDPGVMDTGMQEEIRAADESVFDRVEEFRGYKESGTLRKPEDVAKQLVDRYILHWSAETLREEIE